MFWRRVQSIHRLSILNLLLVKIIMLSWLKLLHLDTCGCCNDSSSVLDRLIEPPCLSSKKKNLIMGEVNSKNIHYIRLITCTFTCNPFKRHVHFPLQLLKNLWAYNSTRITFTNEPRPLQTKARVVVGYIMTHNEQ